MRVAEGQTINLTCNVLGIPQPLIAWLREDKRLTSGGHFIVMPEGHLQISVRVFSSSSFKFIMLRTLSTVLVTNFYLTFQYRIIL